MNYNNHIISQKYINFDPVREDPSKICDPFYITKSINGWSVRFSVDEYGAISVIGWRNLGTLDQGGHGNEAKLNLTLDTTSKRAPAIKIVSGSNFHEPAYIEIDDRRNRTSEGFKADSEFYRRVYPASSVLTPEEFFNEAIPNYTQLLNDKKFSEYVLNISKESSEVQKPYNKSWKPSK